MEETIDERKKVARNKTAAEALNEIRQQSYLNPEVAKRQIKLKNARTQR